jgi:hypothetical protein
VITEINFKRVVLGGLVAGVVLNTGEFLLNEVFFVKEMEAITQRLNIPRPDTKFNLIASALTFVMGVVIVLTYALIRPRLGPGFKTAIVAGLVAWFCIYGYAAILNSLLFGIPLYLLGIGMIWGLVEYSTAAVAGAWVYKES